MPVCGAQTISLHHAGAHSLPLCCANLSISRMKIFHRSVIEEKDRNNFVCNLWEVSLAARHCCHHQREQRRNLPREGQSKSEQTPIFHCHCRRHRFPPIDHFARVTGKVYVILILHGRILFAVNSYNK